jgi:DNA repair protein RadD
MTDINLYDYQAQAIEALRENIRKGTKKQVLCAPTGSGKTIMATYLIQAAYERGSKAIFLCDRIALINQTSEVLDRYGIPHGVIQADHWRHRPNELIQVASQNTLERRGWPAGVDLMIVDECHTMRKATTEQIVKTQAVVIGLTATPFTDGMGEVYQEIVSVTTTNKLITDGRLSPFTIFAPATIDMSGAKEVAGEWTDAERERRALRVVGDVVENYLKYGSGRKFIAFGSTINHCRAIRTELMNAGVRCELYTANTPDTEREQILAEYRKPNSQIHGLVSVAALAKGFDVPDVSCLIIARPLKKSFAEHIQIIGRGLRADPADLDKKCVIIDHAENCIRFGADMAEFFENSVQELPEKAKRGRKKFPIYDYYAHYVEGDQVIHLGKMYTATEAILPGMVPGIFEGWEVEVKDPEWRKCHECKHVHPPKPECPECGFVYPVKQVLHEAGELTNIEFVAGHRAEQLRWYSGLLHYARARNFGKAEGWAAHKFRDKFGVWPSPSVKAVEPRYPDPDVSGWVTSEFIRWKKGTRARA